MALSGKAASGAVAPVALAVPVEVAASVGSAGGLAASALSVVTVRYFAGAQVAAGRSSELVPLTESAAAATLGELLRVLAELHGEPLARVLTAASYLVNEVSCRDRTAALPAGATVDVLPPFAGG